MIKKRENEHENSGLSIDDEISQFWCRVIEGMIQDTVQKTLRALWVEQYAEVEIIDVDVVANTVTCRNIQTGEIFNNVPNYSNLNFQILVNEKGQSIAPTRGRGRMFITNINDNPYYLGVWYN